MSAYEPVIGLEIHVQLATRTKMFCACELSFGEPPNTRTCPVCLGLPGALPVANARAIHFGLMIGRALDCEIAARSIFHRKNYFYPDSPKAYQISQYDEPLCGPGHLGDVRIHRVHLEEDAAKLTHAGASGRIHGSQLSVVDFNRCGTPLVEIVTEPDINSPEQAREWLTVLRATLRQIGVSDVNMAEGSLRCDANVSLRPPGSDQLGTKTELKNMNSFRFLEQGIRAEIERQRGLLGAGEAVEQQTLHFDPASGRLTTLRSKEEAHDYRYFPEPDLVPVAVTEDMRAAADAALPELPVARAQRYRAALGLSADSARQLAFRGELGEFFERALTAAQMQHANGSGGGPPAQAVANWVTQLAGLLGDAEPAQWRVTPEALAALVALVTDRTITAGTGATVLARLVAEGGDPIALVEAEGLGAVGASDALAPIVAAAIEANADAAEKIRGGKMGAIGPIIGYVMRETQGRAEGSEVTRLVLEQLGV